MRILITTSKMTYLDIAVQLGSQVHQVVGGEMTFLTVIPNENKRPRAEAALARARELVEKAGFQIETRILIGSAVESIVEELAANNYDLMVIGERAKRRFALPFQLPIAERVIAHIPCPVLIARGRPRPFRRILVCESGHEPPLVNDLTGKMAPLLDQVEKLTILHVMSQIAAGPGVAGWELRAKADDLIQEHTPEGILLEEVVVPLKPLKIHPETKVRHGLVVREILSESQEGDYDLVVIGARPEKGWEHFLLDDLARDIINQIDRPLLVIKR